MLLQVGTAASRRSQTPRVQALRQTRQESALDASISAAILRQSLGSSEPPLVIDVRRRERFLESGFVLKGSLGRDPERVQEWRCKEGKNEIHTWTPALYK